MMHTYQGETISFSLNKKKRKSVGIHINIYGDIEIRAPKEVSDEVIIELVEKKWDWIIKKTKEMKERTADHKVKTYEQGDVFLYQGIEYPIMIHLDHNLKQDYIILHNNVLQIYVQSNEEEIIRQALKRFYYQQCKSIVEDRIRFFQSNFKMKPRSIRISDNKSNWGTCDSKLQLTFHWKLAMAPIKVIDYVVVHEMCHMVHLNHDRSFWRLVGKFLPDYEERKSWLTLNSWKMTI